jgi:hypothetical protein
MDYLLLVIQKDPKVSIDNLLAPYYKHKEVEPYLATTKKELTDQMKADIKDKLENGEYAEYLAAKKEFDEMPTKENKKKLKELTKACKKIIPEMEDKATWDDERCFQEALKTFHYPGEWQENGDFISTHNPDSHWDYHRTGGMFENILPLKNGLKATIAKMGEIDFGPQPEQYMEAALEWENNKALQTVSRESYCTFNSSLIPFGVLVDNIWFDRNDPTFFQKYNVLTHDRAYDDYTVTALECHI